VLRYLNQLYVIDIGHVVVLETPQADEQLGGVRPGVRGNGGFAVASFPVAGNAVDSDKIMANADTAQSGSCPRLPILSSHSFLLTELTVHRKHRVRRLPWRGIRHEQIATGDLPPPHSCARGPREH